MKNQFKIFDFHIKELRQYNCQTKCMLYSAFIVPKDDRLVVLSGTVFGQILIWRVSVLQSSGSSPVLTKLEGHNGVIFSVHYNNGFICSSSDDRSTILWCVKTKCIHDELEEKHPAINAVRKYRGHQSRIFRSFLTKDALLSAGEDSIINVWNFEGTLSNKLATNQGGPIWALDCNGHTILSGDGSGGVQMSSIVSANCTIHRLKGPIDQVPKTVGFLNHGNMIVSTESGHLYFYHDLKKTWTEIIPTKSLNKYCLVKVSECRSLFLIAGYGGQLYIYQSREDTVKLLAAHDSQNKTRICSLHWLSCQTFLTCNELGVITLYFFTPTNDIISIKCFDLPTSLDVCSTAACQMENGLYVIGDKRGNIHLYNLYNSEPVQTLRKVHDRLGITRLINCGKKILSLGRNGTVKTFILNRGRLRLCSTDKVPFVWLTDLIDSSFVLGFSGKSFVIWDYKSRRMILEHLCGGGHRSWDFLRQNEKLIFTYVKEGAINNVIWDERKTIPKNVVSGYHVGTINSVCIVKAFCCSEKRFIIASGSEDTTLRIAAVAKDDFSCLAINKSHLSSIKTMCFHPLPNESCLLFSGGGRGQIICWKLCLDQEFQVFQEYSHYEENSEQLLESEVRIMDLKVMQFPHDLLLFSACSDGNVDVFQVQDTANQFRLSRLTNLSYQIKCVSKVSLVKLTSFYILISMSTDGTVAFWDLSHLEDKTSNIAPFRIFKIHQSGILSSCFYLVDDDRALLLTGGDDGAIVVCLYKVKYGANSVDFLPCDRLTFETAHCAQVTGIWMCQQYFLTTSIDQKLLVFKWSINNEKQCLVLEMMGRYDSAVADIQGMECEQDSKFFYVFLYGKGVEYVVVDKHKITL